ncbi:MAG: tetratricopeptide repeat protein [Bryobacteraceae bacterium]
MMDGERWSRMQVLFHGAAEIPPADRRAFLETRGEDDPDLVEEVLALLAADARSDSLLDRGVGEIAREILWDNASLLSKQIGPYRLTRLLGEGGMGVVYLAEREDLQSAVAIKVLRDGWLSPARRERFAGEQRTLARLNHPSIARLYDASTLPDGTSWFAMEYVEGVPLTAYCKEHRCWIGERLRLFRAVCEAVQYAHGHAIIHRDLKPSNILVKNDGTVRLLDFGIAKQLDDWTASASRTKTGLLPMTPAYAAPEQIRGEPIGTYTDVYALGVIFYELLAGHLPFDLSHCTPGEAEALIGGSEPEKPSVAAKRAAGSAAPANQSSWEDLDVLCLSAMHKDPQRRYRTVDAIIRDVDHYLNGEPLEACPDSFSYRLGKFVRRNRRPVIAAAAAFLTIASLIVFFTVRLARARDEAVASAARMQSIQQFMLNLFQGDDEQAGPADSLRVVTLVDRGVQQARTLNSEPTVQAELYETLGTIYQKLGDFNQADSLLQLALKRRRELWGPRSAQVADSLVALGLLRAKQARFEEAERLVRQGLEMAQSVLPPKDPAVAEGTTALGQVLEDRGKYDQAIALLSSAVEMQSGSGETSAGLGASLTELANTYFYAGKYKISNTLNQRVLAIDRKLHGEQHPSVASDLINLGAIQYQWGRYVEAEKFDREALAITRAWYGEEHPETASVMTILARALIAEKRDQEAEDLLRPALAIEERVYGKVHPAIASTLNELGGIALRRGQLDEAEKLYRRQEKIYQSVYGDHHYLTALGIANLGKVYFARKQYAEAERLFRDVVRRDTEALSASHQFTAVARIELGRTLLRQHRYAEAEKESRAGYEALVKTSPQGAWLPSARRDLAEIYRALHRPEQARPFEAGLAVR